MSAGICRDRHQAEEIVQEAFVKLWRKPPDAGEIAWASWLRRVVTNLSINALQRTKRPGMLPEFSNDPAMKSEQKPDAASSSREQMGLLREAMDRLDGSKRTILMLRGLEQLSYEEIAEHLGVPVGTVMSRLNRARTALSDELAKLEAETVRDPEAFTFSKYKQGG